MRGGPMVSTASKEEDGIEEIPTASMTRPFRQRRGPESTGPPDGGIESDPRMTSNDVHARGTWVVVIAGTDSPTASVAATPRRDGGAEVKRPSAYRIHSGARSMLQR